MTDTVSFPEFVTISLFPPSYSTKSLGELAQILDNQISSALPLNGYLGHLVTFQINVQPKGRNLPYDAYVNLTLMPASWAKALKSSKDTSVRGDELSPIIVFPLVIADAMESSNVGRSVELIRQAALSLSGVVSSVGVNAGVSGGSDRIDSLIGADRNSLVTVGRVSDHTLRIRLGAQQQGSRQLALVPRTQNISVVIFTRLNENPKEHLDKLAVITETTFVDVDTGEEVSSEDSPKTRFGISKLWSTASERDSLRQRVEEIITNYGFVIDKGRCSEIDTPLDILRSLDRGDYSFVSKCISAAPAPLSNQTVPHRTFLRLEQAPLGDSPSAALPGASKSLFDLSADLTARSLPKDHTELPSFQPIEEALLRRVVAALMTLQSESRFSKLMIPLTGFRDRTVRAPIIGQLVFLRDDESSAKVTLLGGANLDKTRLRAKLMITQNGKSLMLLPTTIDTDTARSTITLSFPSISANKLMSKTTALPPDDAAPDPMTLELDYTGTDADAAERPPAFSHPQIFPARLLAVKAQPTANPISVTSTVLVADAARTARISLTIGKWDATAGKPLFVTISGADLRAIEPEIKIDAARKAIPVTGESVVTLTFGNLTPSQNVQIKTLADKEAVGAPITLSVEPQAHSK